MVEAGEARGDRDWGRGRRARGAVETAGVDGGADGGGEGVGWVGLVEEAEGKIDG